MTVPIFVPVLLATLLVGGAVAITFWENILNWVNDTLNPWIKNYLPWLEPYVRNAFSVIDGVFSPVRSMIKQAWNRLRQYLLKVLVQFERNTQNEWVKKITYWAIRTLQSKEPEAVRVVVEEIVDFSDLPSDVREEWLKRGNTTQDIDVTQLRDRELAMTN